jgi:heme exporter protein D
MNWNSATEFFAMGGYGLYVWGSYAVALALMVIEPVLARQRHRRAWRDAVDQAAAPGSQR